MAKKWIINDGQILIGNVDYHKQLISPSMKRSKTIGGGFWEFYNKRLYFYGSSEDFGSITKEQFDSALVTSRLPNSYKSIELVFSNKQSLSEVLLELNH